MDAPRRRALGFVIAYIISANFWVVFSPTLVSFILPVDIGPVYFVDFFVEEILILTTAAALFVALTREYRAIARSLGTELERKKVEQTLTHSEAVYRAVVEDQTDLICRFTLPERTITFANHAYCRYFFRTVEEVIGSKFDLQIQQDESDIVSWKRGRITPQHPVIVYWCRIEIPRKGVRWMQWTEHGLYDGAGNLLEIQAVGQDTTDRKMAELALKHRNEELLALMTISATLQKPLQPRDLLAAALEKIVEALDVDGSFAYWVENSSPVEFSLAAQYMSVPFQMPVNLQKLTYAGQAEGGTELANWIAQQVASEFQLVGQPIANVLCAPLISKGDLLGVLGVFTKTPHDLSGSRKQLLLTIGNQVSTSIENMKLAALASELEILREVDKLRSQLIANVSHELRTPLGLIRLFATTLSRNDMQLAAETEREFLHNIEDETVRLEHIVENLLDLSRLQQARLRLELVPTNVAGLLCNAAGLAQFKTRVKDIVLDIPPEPIMLSADPMRLEQVFVNLLSNAVKYSELGTPIEVSCVSSSTDVLIRVRDQGVGIPPKEVAHVFDSFYRAANVTSTKMPGVGLGLAICKGIVEGHGGRIWVESALAVGSTFFVAIPKETGAELN